MSDQRSMLSHSFFGPQDSPARPLATSRALILVRLLTGLVFLLEGIKKFLMVADWGAGRFSRIGIWRPEITAPFVGGVEILCGALLLVGLLTRIATMPLLIDITVAILATKVPILASKGFWAMEAEARTDYAMLLGLLFLLFAGAGAWFPWAAPGLWSGMGGDELASSVTAVQLALPVAVGVLGLWATAAWWRRAEVV